MVNHLLGKSKLSTYLIFTSTSGWVTWQDILCNCGCGCASNPCHMIIEISTITVSRCWDLMMVFFQNSEVLCDLANQFKIRRSNFELPDGILALMATIAMLGLIDRRKKVECNASVDGLLKVLSSFATTLVREHEIVSAVAKVLQICFEFLRKTDSDETLRSQMERGWLLRICDPITPTALDPRTISQRSLPQRNQMIWELLLSNTLLGDRRECNLLCMF